MDTKVLSQIIPAADAKDLEQLLAIVRALEGIEDLVTGFIYGHGNDNRFVYLSPVIEKITGYTASDFQSDGGYQLFYSITPPEYRAHVVERAAFYTREAKQKDFSVIHPPLMEMSGALSHKDGSISKVRYLGMVLEFTRDRDILFTLCTWQKVDLFSESRLMELKEMVYVHLSSFKEIYVRIHRDRFHHNGYHNDGITKVVYPLYSGPAVTKKEYEVLCLIANGCSSKQIAHQLNISFHTAETHRKHLLGKFDAINSAELMKKASKVYWFE